MGVCYSRYHAPVERLHLADEALVATGYRRLKTRRLPGLIVAGVYLARVSTSHDQALAIIDETFYALVSVSDCKRLETVLREQLRLDNVEITALFVLTQPKQFAVRVREQFYFVDVHLHYVRKIPGSFSTCLDDWLLGFRTNRLYFVSAITGEEHWISVRHAEYVDNVWEPENCSGVFRATITDWEMHRELRDIEFSRGGEVCGIREVLADLTEETARDIIAVFTPSEPIYTHDAVEMLAEALPCEVTPLQEEEDWVVHLGGEPYCESLDRDDVLVFIRETRAFVIRIDAEQREITSTQYKRRYDRPSLVVTAANTT